MIQYSVGPDGQMVPIEVPDVPPQTGDWQRVVTPETRTGVTFEGTGGATIRGTMNVEGLNVRPITYTETVIRPLTAQEIIEQAYAERAAARIQTNIAARAEANAPTPAGLVGTTFADTGAQAHIVTNPTGATWRWDGNAMPTPPHNGNIADRLQALDAATAPIRAMTDDYIRINNANTTTAHFTFDQNTGHNVTIAPGHHIALDQIISGDQIRLRRYPIHRAPTGNAPGTIMHETVQYMVHSQGRGPTNIRHPDYASARAEAIRLASVHPTWKFDILMAIEGHVIPPPQMERQLTDTDPFGEEEAAW